MGTTLRSELGKTCDEFARLWLIAHRGSGTHDWDTPLESGKDVMLIAVGPTSSGTIKNDLQKALDAERAQSVATLSDSQKSVLASFRLLLTEAFEAQRAPEGIDVDSVLKFIHILEFDPAGELKKVAEARLENALDLPETAPAAFQVIERECQNAMTARSRLDASKIHSALDSAGTPVKARNESVLETQIEIRDDQKKLLEGNQDILRAVSSGTQAENPIVTREAQSVLRRLKQSRFAIGSEPEKEANRLMNAVEHGDLVAASSTIKQSVYAWCARILATNDLEAANRALNEAEKIGDSDETAIARAILHGFTKGADKTEALQLLNELASAEALTASLIIVAHEEPPLVGLTWWKSTGFDLDRLHPDGKFRILHLQIVGDDWPDALLTAQKLKEEDFHETPALLFLAATANLGQAIHADFRDVLQLPLPPQPAEFPLKEDTVAMGHRQIAGDLYMRSAAKLTELRADKAAAIASDRALWLALRNKATRSNAFEELDKSMTNEKVRLRRVPLAIAFGRKLKIEAIEQDIERTEALTGGRSTEAIVARLEVALMRKVPEVANYIENHREQLVKYYAPGYIDALAVEALVKSGRTEDARDKLKQSNETITDKDVVATLQNLIEEAEGADPIARRESEYLDKQTVQSLINFFDELKRARDFPRIAKYGETVFRELKTVESARSYIIALSEIYADNRIVEFAENNPEMVQNSQDIKAALSWAYFRLGCLPDSKAVLAALRVERDVASDRFLSIKLAIASGDWSSLSTFVESEWVQRNDREPSELLSTGILAQRIGSSSRSKELIREAASRAVREGDAHILAGAYLQASSDGWENDTEINEWIKLAIEKSGEDGPFQRIDVREIFDNQPRWNERIDNTWLLLLSGEAPMFAAAQASSRTLLDLTLRSAFQNLKQSDPRKRGMIFSFAGNRQIEQLPGKRIALDITSLLTLGLAGLLHRALDWSETITISHTTLSWMFEERAKLMFHQPSQVKRAREVKHLIDTGNLHRFEGDAPPTTLEYEVGDDIARYLVAAQTLDPKDTSQKVVVRPYPLFRPDSFLEVQSDIGGYENHIAGCSDVIEALRSAGQLSEMERTHALTFLRVQERPWPHNPRIQPGAILYIDDVALSYFQHLKLLEKLARAGFKVFVSPSEADRADELINYEEIGIEVHAALEEMQRAIRDGIASGKVKLSRLAPSDSEGNDGIHPSQLLIAEPLDVNVYVVDDRSMNKFPSINDLPIMTSIDLLATMAEDGTITLAQLTEVITGLRQSGLLLIPFRENEIESLLNNAHVEAGNLQETSELRAIRESIQRAQMADILQLPIEGQWIDTLNLQLTAALENQWNDATPDNQSRARSSWIVDLYDFRKWAHRATNLSMNALDRYRAQVFALLVLPVDAPAARERYLQWLEDAVLKDYKTEQPHSYSELLVSVQKLVDQHIAQAFLEEDFDDKTIYAREAFALLKLFPALICDDMMEDKAFRDRYGLTFDTTITFNNLGMSFKRSEFHSAIRTLYAETQSSFALENTDGMSIELQLEQDEKDPPKLYLVYDEVREQIPAFEMLADNKDIRSALIDRDLTGRNLLPETIATWTRKLQSHSLSDDEIDEFMNDLRSTPQKVEVAIREEFRKEEGAVSVLVPGTRRYYRGLIGDRGEAKTIEEYTVGNARVQIDRLLNWDFKLGLAQCLLFCATPRLSALIDISGKPADEVENFYKFLAKNSDRFSQIAGIEIGVRALAEYPRLEPILLKLLEEMRDEVTSSSSTRLALTANAFIAVDGELARTKIFADEPPFWRRLAATAQASMIERVMVTLGAAGEDWSEWGLLWGEQFYMQNLIDLREEPRWMPELMSAKQLRVEFLMRARIAGNEAQATLPEGPLRDFLLGKELETLTSVPSAYAPSPVEGGVEAPRPFPEELLNDLRNSMNDKALEERTLASAVNFSQVFRFDQEIAGIIAKLLRKVKYRVSLRHDSEITFTVLMGLASIAASARHPGLADEVRVLARVLARRGDLSGDFESHMRIALLACASRKDKGEWCKAVGDWLLEIAHGKLEREDAVRFRSHLHKLLHAAPELWANVAKADAALSLISD